MCEALVIALHALTPEHLAAALRGWVIVIPIRRMRKPRHRKTKHFAKVTHSVLREGFELRPPGPGALKHSAPRRFRRARPRWGSDWD